MIDRVEFRKYLIGMDSFLSSNDNNLFLMLWGAVYLYDFLYEQGVISKLIYNSAQKVFSWTKEDVLSAYSKNLWKYNFIHNWSKPDSVGQYVFEQEEKLFINTFHNKDVENSPLISSGKQTNQENKVRSIKVGRNDPCPCGSKRKYKKCCLRKMEKQTRKWKNKQKTRSRCWLIEEIEKMETREIIDKLFYFGIYFNADVFWEKVENCSLEEVVDEWYNRFSIRAGYFDHDFIKLAAQILKSRLSSGYS